MSENKMADQGRDSRGRFDKKRTFTKKTTITDCEIDHNYCVGLMCEGDECVNSECGVITLHNEKKRVGGKLMKTDSWRIGRRIIELGVLLDQLKVCVYCRLGPIPLTCYNVVGELKRGLGGFLYVKCENVDCGMVNRVAYGKTHRQNATGMPSFSVNTKLGTAMIDSVGGAVRVNNFLATLNIPTINPKNLKHMEDRAGGIIETVANRSMLGAAKDAYQKEMIDIAQTETHDAKKSMDGLVEELGVAPMPDASPHTKQILHNELASKSNNNSDDDSICDDLIPESQTSNTSVYDKTAAPKKKISHFKRSEDIKSKKNIELDYPCKTRTGMTCAVDTAWQKRGFDSLTSHTFFMTKAKYGKKVVKSVVSHRTCGKCKWWRRNRPDERAKKHECVHNHTGSARLMESLSGEKGLKDLQEEGTSVEYLEGDGDTTLIARLRDSNINLKKRFDKNHVIKNFGKHLRSLKNDKKVRISDSVISHLQKCVSYAFAKNAGDRNGLKENLIAIIPHQFGDHTKCFSRFCGYIRNPGVKYIHRSLPYNQVLKDINLKLHLGMLLQPYITNVDQYCDLGSSQQCEHANKEVSLRAPKSFHYGNTKSLDYRVLATSAFINEGRKYIPQVNSEAGLSPGEHTTHYAEKCDNHRKRVHDRSVLPSIKRRRLILKQERAISKVAHESLEGASYNSEIGHLPDADISKIPDPVPRGDFKAIKLKDILPTVICFDLETTDLIRGGHMPQITQIAACDNSGKIFNQYVKPTEPISQSASQITGITYADNQMSVNGDYVPSVSVTEALELFCSWIETFNNVFLVAHNGRRFDFPVIISKLYSLNLLERFYVCVLGCVDSLPFFRKMYPNQTSFKQVDLIREILQCSYGAHNASEDVLALSKLLQNVPDYSKHMLPFSFTPKAIHHGILFNKEKNKNMQSICVLVANGICKTATAENIAGSGLNLNNLMLIFKREGEDGLRNTFIVKNSEGQPRVTNTKRTLESVIPALADFLRKQDKK